MLKTKPQSTASVSSASAVATDPLQDPLTAPPVDNPGNPGGITSDDILQSMTLIHGYGAALDSFRPLAPMVAANLSNIHTQWLAVEIEVGAGLLSETKALYQYHQLCGELSGYMNAVPDGLHPELDALKAKAMNGLDAYILKAIELEQQARISAQDHASVGAIRDSLMNATKTR